MNKPKIAAKQPAEVSLEAGKTYAWCACGLSENQPFCDGAHSKTDLKPKVFKAEKSETAWLCQCKQTSGSPFCDGTHNGL
jgi:CDGSH-type Zn-finger protein